MITRNLKGDKNTNVIDSLIVILIIFLLYIIEAFLDIHGYPFFRCIFDSIVNGETKENSLDVPR